MKKSVIGIVAGFFSGLFGAGGGAILILSLERFLKVDAHKAHATTVAIILPIAIVTSIIYLYDETNINWFAILYTSIGGVAGGYLGARYLNKISGKMLHRIFGIFMIAAALRMIL